MKDKIDCLIVSTGRSGSSAIYKYLNEIADLNLPEKKEPHYLCDIYRYDGLYDNIKKLHVSEADVYYDLYSDSRLAIDASVGYFFCIDEVISNLSKVNHKPKVIFLYREPLGRAVSHFNKLKGKGLINNVKIVNEVKLNRRVGLWWERYYDNVDYFNAFKSIESYFDDIMAINYDLFSKEAKFIMNNILNFLDVERLREIDYKPINTSSEAVLISWSRSFSFLRFLLSDKYRSKLKKYLMKYVRHEDVDVEHVISPYMRNSLEQYAKFRSYIKNRDILCLKK